MAKKDKPKVEIKGRQKPPYPRAGGVMASGRRYGDGGRAKKKKAV